MSAEIPATPVGTAEAEIEEGGAVMLALALALPLSQGHMDSPSLRAWYPLRPFRLTGGASPIPPEPLAGGALTSEQGHMGTEGTDDAEGIVDVDVTAHAVVLTTEEVMVIVVATCRLWAATPEEAGTALDDTGAAALEDAVDGVDEAENGKSA